MHGRRADFVEHVRALGFVMPVSIELAQLEL